MDLTEQSLPSAWKERWMQEKEQKKRVLEEGGEKAEEENRRLKWIIAYNSQRMGISDEGAKPRKGMELEEDEEEHEEQTYFSKTYPAKLFHALLELKDSKHLTDLTLKTVDGSPICTHSVVIAAVCSTIEELLHQRGGMISEGCGSCITLGAEVKHLGLTAVVEFAYTGDIKGLYHDKAAQVESAAKALGAPRVEELCRRTAEGGKNSPVAQLEMNLQGLKQLWMEHLGCDVELGAEGRVVHAHRAILAASSDYFRGMFTSGMRESHQSSITLPSLGCEELDVLLCCSYTGTIPLSWGTVFQMTDVSLQLQAEPALSMCLRFLHQQIDADSCLDVASFAEAYGMRDLGEMAEDFVLRHFQEVAASPKFLDLTEERLLGYVQQDSLCVPSELAVFRAIVSWIEADRQARMGQAKQLMEGVRFPLMTFREFREVRAINLRFECSGERELELYGTALKEFGFSLPDSREYCRKRYPKDALVVVGGDQLDSDFGQRVPSRNMWFANCLRNHTGLVKEIEWRLLGDIPEPARFRHGVAILNGELYIAGGCHYYGKSDTLKSAYKYNPENNTWQQLADMKECRSNFTLVVREKRLYAVGGDRDIQNNLDSVECYNLENNSWSFAHPLDQSMSGFAARLWEGEIFISGGFNCTYQCLVSMFLYHPERGTTYLSEMSQDRALHCMESLGGRFYVAGGVCNYRKFYTDQLSCECYDPHTDSWSSVPSLQTPHVGAASVVLEDRVYILGGYCQEDYREPGLIHRYEMASCRWENVGRMPGANSDIGACVIRLPLHLRQ